MRPQASSLGWATGVFAVMLLGSGCGDDLKCPRGTDPATCRMTGDHGSAPDVPTFVDVLGDVSGTDVSLDTDEAGPGLDTEETDSAPSPDGSEERDEDDSSTPESEEAQSLRLRTWTARLHAAEETALQTPNAFDAAGLLVLSTSPAHNTSTHTTNLAATRFGTGGDHA